MTTPLYPKVKVTNIERIPDKTNYAPKCCAAIGGTDEGGICCLNLTGYDEDGFEDIMFPVCCCCCNKAYCLGCEAAGCGSCLSNVCWPICFEEIFKKGRKASQIVDKNEKKTSKDDPFDNVLVTRCKLVLRDYEKPFVRLFLCGLVVFSLGQIVLRGLCAITIFPPQ